MEAEQKQTSKLSYDEQPEPSPWLLPWYNPIDVPLGSSTPTTMIQTISTLGVPILPTRL